MKKLVLALAATTFMSTAALAEDIKIGVFLGFTGPIESMVANMGPGAEMATGSGLGIRSRCTLREIAFPAFPPEPAVGFYGRLIDDPPSVKTDGAIGDGEEPS